jgi:hypothetical protein
MATRLAAVVTLALLAACGGGTNWHTASAVGLSNPVLLGPVAHVGPPAPDPSAWHALGDRVSVSMWEVDRFAAHSSSSRVTTRGGQTVTTTRNTTRRYERTTIPGAGALGFAILAHLAPRHAPPHENGAWQEPYRPTDVVRVEGLRVQALTSTERSATFSQQGYRSSASVQRLGVTLDNAYYYHLGPPPLPPPLPPVEPPPAVPPPPEAVELVPTPPAPAVAPTTDELAP